MTIAELELDLEVFSGPFDLLLAVLLRQEIDVLELSLADLVLAYLEHLERAGELDLEAGTEFLVLIAALLELKSRLLLGGEEESLEELEAPEAAEELLARMLEALRYRGAGRHLVEALAGEQGVRFRSAPVPAELRRAVADPATQTFPASRLGAAIGQLLRVPPKIDVGHMARPRVTVAQRLELLRGLLRRGNFSFEEAVADANDRATVAVTLFALLELYKRGEARWEQRQSFGEITVRALGGRSAQASPAAVGVSAVAPVAPAAQPEATGALLR